MGKVNKKSNKVTKSRQLETFSDNVESELKMECCNCSDSFVENYGVGDVDDYEIIKKEFAKKAYEEGWRYSVSSVFQHVGIHCPECHKYRNNKKHFEF